MTMLIGLSEAAKILDMSEDELKKGVLKGSIPSANRNMSSLRFDAEHIERYKSALELGLPKLRGRRFPPEVIKEELFKIQLEHERRVYAKRLTDWEKGLRKGKPRWTKAMCLEHWKKIGIQRKKEAAKRREEKQRSKAASTEGAKASSSPGE